MDTEGRQISNHSAQVTLCSSLFNETYTDKAVSSRSHPRSNALHTYQRESFNTLNDLCNILDSKPQRTQNKESASRTQNQNKSPVLNDDECLMKHVPKCVKKGNYRERRETCVLCIFLEQLFCMSLLHLFSIKMVNVDKQISVCIRIK